MRSGSLLLTRWALRALVITVIVLTNRHVSAQLIESWEGGANGWVTTSENATYVYAPENVLGVTNQNFSANLSGTAGPSYGQMWRGPALLTNTQILANAASVSVDVLAGPSFGFQQWSLIVNGGTLGYHSVDGFTFSQSPILGQESTLTWNISPADRAAYAADAAIGTQVQLIFQVGGGGPGTMYLDNLRAAPVPEPASALFGIGGGAALLLRRKR